MVNTFLPHPCFQASLACLDNKRIHKQSIEAYQLWLALTYPGRASHPHHPILRMWRGYEVALKLYIVLSVEETSRRLTKQGKPFKTDKMRANIAEHKLMPTAEELANLKYPWWFGHDAFHARHRAMLYRKDRIHYASFLPDAYNYAAYVWPASSEHMDLSFQTSDELSLLAAERGCIVSGVKLTSDHINRMLACGISDAVGFALQYLCQNTRLLSKVKPIIYPNMPIEYANLLLSFGWKRL